MTTATEDQPLWQQAAVSKGRTSSIPFLSAGAPVLASEAATALLVGPPLVVGFDDGMPMPRSSPLAIEFRQSVFSQTVSTLIAMMWMTVPAPEVSVLLLDWSELLFVDTADSSKGNKRNNKSAQLGSPWVYEVLQQLVQGRVKAVRQLYFGQVVLAGQDKDDDALLVTSRNQHGMSVLQKVLNQQQNRDGTAATATDIALLYGCHHCEELIQMGFKQISPKQWRTAFDVPRVKVSAPSDKTRSMESFLSSWTNSALENPTPTVGIMVLLLSYLVIGGMDWIATWQDVISAAPSLQAVSSDAALYLIRHVMLYVALSKLLLDSNWTENRR